MSLTFNFKLLFTREYINSSIEELHGFIQEGEEDIEYLLERQNNFNCECNLSSHRILTREYDDGRFLVEFCNLDVEAMSMSICDTCNHSILHHASFPIQEYHPLLMLEAVGYTTHLFELAKFCKEQKYNELSREDLENKRKETYEYSRYLRRCEKQYHEVPSGLLEHMDKNENELDALEFEIKARSLAAFAKSDADYEKDDDAPSGI